MAGPTGKFDTVGRTPLFGNKHVVEILEKAGSDRSSRAPFSLEQDELVAFGTRVLMVLEPPHVCRRTGSRVALLERASKTMVDHTGTAVIAISFRRPAVMDFSCRINYSGKSDDCRGEIH